MKNMFDMSQSSWTPAMGLVTIVIIVVVSLAIIMVKSNHWTHRRKRKEDFDECCRLIRTETAAGREVELFDAIIHISRRYEFPLNEHGFANEGSLRDATLGSLRRTMAHLAEDHELDLAGCNESRARENFIAEYKWRMDLLQIQHDALEKRIISEPPVLRCFA